MRLTVRIAEKQEDFFRLIRLREEVFVIEQGVPLEIELDDEDDRAIHFVAISGREVIGTARLVVKGRSGQGKSGQRKSGKIGRMAVRKDWRGKGVGTALIDFIKKSSKRKRLIGLYLHAQESALSFYQHLGFNPEGDRFYEAGIPHRKMILNEGRWEEVGGRRKIDKRGDGHFKCNKFYLTWRFSLHLNRDLDRAELYYVE
ncbi:MAG: GNAT family N-acetyltransferase [Candidatus Manganitrophus sp.]|nr:GNAT family N-acetyltransferase [Candidatus Manganitrophus sp.]WDT72597.1 MAG: GNAT family N-acetyltransferase [Candidatus Manganitrophus sp.]